MSRQDGAPETDGKIWLIAAGSLGLLALITAIISYSHGLDVVRATGTTGLVAYLVPFVADLMIVSGSMAILEAARDGAGWPPLAIASLVVGVGSTLAMNVLGGTHHGHWSAGPYVGAFVAALSPVALVLALETLMNIVRRRRARATRGQPVATGGQCPHGVAMTADEAVVRAFLHGRDCLEEEPSQRQLSAAFGVHRDKVRKLVGSLNGQHPEDPGETPPDE